MGAKRHYLSDMDTEARTGVCAVCGPVKLKKAGRGGWRCRVAWLENNREQRQRTKKSGNDRWRTHVGTACSRCGFEPEHIRQLEIHHANRDRTDNRPENLVTLCANCHRLEHAPPSEAA